MAFTASILWFLWIGLEGDKLKPKLDDAVSLDTTEPQVQFCSWRCSRC